MKKLPCFQVSHLGKGKAGTNSIYPEMAPGTSTSNKTPPCRVPKDLTKDTSSRMSPKVAARSVRSSLTCLETSSLWVMSSPASKRAWYQGRAEDPVRVMRKQREPGNYQPHPNPPTAKLSLLPSVLGLGLRPCPLTTTDLRISVVIEGSTRSS